VRLPRPDAIGVVWPTFDAAGALVDFEVGYTNPSSERMMGVRLGDEVGARLREVMPGVVTMGLYDRLLRVAETREAESAEITLDTMWRDAIHVRGVWVHTVLPFGSGLLSVAFDVSEERRRENELRDFAAVAAHDLREPLLGVHLMAALLGRRGGLGVEEQEMVRLLDDGVQRATGLVDSILEYATAADDGASRTEVDCGEVVSEVLATLASQIEHVDGRVEVGALPILPGCIAACLAAVERFEERADGDRVVLLRIALQVRDEGATPPPVHQLDADQAVHRRPDEVRVGRRVGEIGPPIGDAGREHFEGRESCQAAGVGRNEIRGRPLEHESVERLVVERERAVGQRECQQLLPALTIRGDAVEPVL